MRLTSSYRAGTAASVVRAEQPDASRRALRSRVRPRGRPRRCCRRWSRPVSLIGSERTGAGTLRFVAELRQSRGQARVENDEQLLRELLGVLLGRLVFRYWRGGCVVAAAGGARKPSTVPRGVLRPSRSFGGSARSAAVGPAAGGACRAHAARGAISSIAIPPTAMSLDKAPTTSTVNVRGHSRLRHVAIQPAHTSAGQLVDAAFQLDPPFTESVPGPSGLSAIWRSVHRTLRSTASDSCSAGGRSGSMPSRPGRMLSTRIWMRES